MQLNGYAMLNGKRRSINAHNNVEQINEMPHPCHIHQSCFKQPQNFANPSYGAALSNANLNNSCPIARSILCNSEYGTIFHILKSFQSVYGSQSYPSNYEAIVRQHELHMAVKTQAIAECIAL